MDTESEPACLLPVMLDGGNKDTSALPTSSNKTVEDSKCPNPVVKVTSPPVTGINLSSSTIIVIFPSLDNGRELVSTPSTFIEILMPSTASIPSSFSSPLQPVKTVSNDKTVISIKLFIIFMHQSFLIIFYRQMLVLKFRYLCILVRHPLEYLGQGELLLY